VIGPDPPDPDWQAWFNTLKCGPDPPWSDKVIYWSQSGSDKMEWTRLGFLKPWCDASRPNWNNILQEWKERKRLYIWLCERHAVACGFPW
jgi:hypothetical protein